MQGTTRLQVYQLALVVLHALVVLSVLGLALLGQLPAEAAGWLIQPAVPRGPAERRRTSGVRVRRPGWPRNQLAALGHYLAASWPPVLLRSLLVWGLWVWSGSWGPVWLRLVPWGWWLWRGLGVGWPRLQAQVFWRGRSGRSGKGSGCCWWGTWG